MNKKVVVAIYIRVSTQDQAREGYSIGEQESRLMKYADAHGWKVKRVYSDPGFSGGNLNRPGIQELIRDVKDHKIEKVIVYKLDRLSRSQKDILYMIDDVFNANGVDFVSMTENFDTGTPMGKAMIGIMAVFAQLEREQIKERMGIGKEGRAKSGLFHGSTKVPIGYRYKDGILIVDPYESVIVKRIFSEFVSGKSVYSIAADLKNDGAMSSYGVITRNTIQTMLKNETYLGVIKHNEKRFQGKHEAIIDQDTFDQAKRRMDASRAKAKGYNYNRLTSPFTGLCYCQHCNQKMRLFSAPPRKSDGVRHRYISCDPKYRKPGCTTKAKRLDQFDQLIMGQIQQLKLDPDYLSECRSASGAVDNQPEIDAFEEKIKENRLKINRLMDLYALGDIDLDIVGEKIQTLNAEIAFAQNSIENLRNDEADSMTDDKIIDTVDRLIDCFDTDDLEEKRLLITMLISRIDFENDEILIHWNF